MKFPHCLVPAAAVALVAAAAAVAAPAGPGRPEPTNPIHGFTNTPLLPGGKWHVHDPRRPQPKWVPPKYDGRPVPPPADAKVLFDGDDLDHWKNKNWKLVGGAMQVTKGSQPSIEQFGDCHLHVEWMVPESVTGTCQKGGNSGVYLMGRYEIQVLNCYDNRTYADGMTAAIYGQKPPDFNACRPRGKWQCYDIYFKAPVFRDGKLVSPAYVTVDFNGIRVQDNVAFLGPTVWRKLAKYTPHGPKGPIVLQAHGNPVLYRNIWVAPLKMRLGK